MADIATCADGLAEVLDPADRRPRYPFTNCTSCGPRFSNVEALPYDRPATSMRAFEMCADCRREYEDPRDRRFHAQPNACPACGPRLSLWNARGATTTGGAAALVAAAAAIRAGRVVAVKGLLWRIVRSMRLAAGRGGRGHRDGRHQGGRSRQGRRRVHHHGRGRERSGRRRRGARVGPPGRRGDPERRRRPPRHGDRGAREHLEFESTIENDCAPLVAPVAALFDAGVDVHGLRDLTRGGLASAVVEIAGSSGLHVHLDERAIPVREDVRAACEILGFDPLCVANEGRFVALVPEADVDGALDGLRAHAVSAGAVRVGTVSADPPHFVALERAIGATRIVDMLSGEQLPRIC